jgi:DNA-binding beta-propeller fold protein YncE
VTRSCLLIVAVMMLTASVAAAGADGPLVVEAKIPLGYVGGRIDHLAADIPRQRLLVAELGNNSLGVVDLAARKTLRTLGGLSEPQGVGYEPSTDTVYVANAGDGSVRIFKGGDFSPLGRIELGDDADNIRIDRDRKQVLVGYGKGAIAIIDPATRTKGAEYRLRGHPEGFQIDGTGTQLFVNIPDAREIAVIDLPNATSRSVATQGLRSNFPMAVDAEAKRVLVVFRSPPMLMAVSSPDTQIVAKAETCGDADDVFVDARRHRVYVVCGAGVVDVFEPRGTGYERLATVPTVSGARTGLFVSELDRLFVAVRASSGEPPAVWVFRPTP